jgi:hypothetical protein
MKRVLVLLPALLLFSGCWNHNQGLKSGWTPTLVQAAESDCIQLWTRRLPSAPRPTVGSICHCVTDKFSTSYSTEELASPTLAQSESSKQMALECVQHAGLDLARMTAPGNSSNHAH